MGGLYRQLNKAFDEPLARDAQSLYYSSIAMHEIEEEQLVIEHILNLMGRFLLLTGHVGHV